jgi:hypothetical protein
MTPDEAYALLAKWSPLIGGFGAFMLPFLYSIVKDATTRRIEAQKPHLERQLVLYTEACQIAVCLATSTNETERTKAEKRFWELYWGELCMVESRGVERAMVKFGKALKQKAAEAELQSASYELAHELRSSLEASWGFRVRKMLPY